MDNKIIDAYGKEVSINESSFKLCQVDSKIHDAKFESKPTTFFKDAFKRFCKNKSSIVGAVIIGLLVLLSILIPIFSTHNVQTEDSTIAKLSPKLFDYQDGSDNIFWTGLELKTDITWDFDNECPVGFAASGVKKIVKTTDKVIETSNQYAGGGVYIVMADKTSAQTSKNFYVYNYTQLTINSTDNYQVSIEMDDNDGAYKTYQLAEYRISLIYNTTLGSYAQDAEKRIVLQDWTSNYDDVDLDGNKINKIYNFNLSQALIDNGLTEVKKARVVIDGKIADELIYFGFSDVTFTSDSEDETVIELLDNVSMQNSNGVINMTKGIDGRFPVGYWQTNGYKGISKLEVRTVDFYYDKYEVKLGDVDKTLGKSELDKYVSLGYCTYDYSVGPESFTILDSVKCPVNKVYNQTTNVIDGLGELTYIDCSVCQYKEKGYASMPKFVFGTDASGFDIITKCFSCLLRSLCLALITSAICFSFGLVWGAISGYFGGNVDLFMERFCEILGGVPWVVVMTLTMLLLEDYSVIVRLGIALCLTGWMGTAATTRTQFYRFKGREYILASRTLGATDLRLIFKHILPNAMGTIITSSVLMIPGVIFSESSLSYIGLLKGSNSFGTILANNQQYLSTYPVLILFPAAIISLIMISFNLFGNGLRDAFNPSLKGSE